MLRGNGYVGFVLVAFVVYLNSRSIPSLIQFGRIPKITPLSDFRATQDFQPFLLKSHPGTASKGPAGITTTALF